MRENFQLGTKTHGKDLKTTSGNAKQEGATVDIEKLFPCTWDVSDYTESFQGEHASVQYDVPHCPRKI